MNLHELLTNEKEDILKLATTGFSRTPLPSYRKSNTETNKQRLTRLFDIATDCIQTKNLIPMMEFSENIAEERYHQHFDLQEVHAAFNVLEEVMWDKITEKMDSKDYPKAFGLVSTVLGFGKESLAVKYLSLVSQKKHLKSLNLPELFKGI